MEITESMNKETLSSIPNLQMEDFTFTQEEIDEMKARWTSPNARNFLETNLDENGTIIVNEICVSGNW